MEPTILSDAATAPVQVSRRTAAVEAFEDIVYGSVRHLHTILPLFCCRSDLFLP